MIEGVKLKQLDVHLDDRGYLMEVMRNDDKEFHHFPWEGLDGFGQVYISAVNPGIVKGFHMHEKQVDRIAVVKGNIKLVLMEIEKVEVTKIADAGLYMEPEFITYTEMEDRIKETMELYIGERNPMLVRIPVGILHGWTPITDEVALVMNVPTQPYNYEKPDEVRFPFDYMGYQWEVKNR